MSRVAGIDADGLRQAVRSGRPMNVKYISHYFQCSQSTFQLEGYELSHVSCYYLRILFCLLFVMCQCAKMCTEHMFMCMIKLICQCVTLNCRRHASFGGAHCDILPVSACGQRER